MKNKSKEPGVAQILMCGKFSKRQTKKIIEAHTEAFAILNKLNIVKD